MTDCEENRNESKVVGLVRGGCYPVNRNRMPAQGRHWTGEGERMDPGLHGI